MNPPTSVAASLKDLFPLPLLPTRVTMV
uniref:Uncharacterized protein n=1 Tax=Rhizophora mucronata TaxID=61149 RepID=A0A2P2JBR7_RHIMU